MKRNIVLSVFIGLYIVGLIASGIILTNSTKINESDSQFNNFTSLAKFNKKEHIIGLIQIDSPISFVNDNSSFLLPGNKGATLWLEQLKIAETNDRIKAIIIRVNSPGGTVGASQELHAGVERIKATGKPVITSVADLSASGGYYATVGSDYIFANQGSLIGSIGVILGGIEFSTLMENWGIKYQAITSGKNKDILSPYKKMSLEQQIFLKKMVSNTYEQFLTAVVKGRKKSESDIRPLADGSVFTGEQAVENGLIDAVGTFEDAIKYTKETYKLTDLKVVKITPASSTLNFKDLISVAVLPRQTPEIKLSLKEYSFGYSPLLYLYKY